MSNTPNRDCQWWADRLYDTLEFFFDGNDPLCAQDGDGTPFDVALPDVYEFWLERRKDKA